MARVKAELMVKVKVVEVVHVRVLKVRTLEHVTVATLYKTVGRQR